MVWDKREDSPPPPMDFDTLTKPEGTQNVKVDAKLKWQDK